MKAVNTPQNDNRWRTDNSQCNNHIGICGNHYAERFRGESVSFAGDEDQHLGDRAHTLHGAPRVLSRGERLGEPDVIAPHHLEVRNCRGGVR